MILFFVSHIRIATLGKKIIYHFCMPSFNCKKSVFYFYYFDFFYYFLYIILVFFWIYFKLDLCVESSNFSVDYLRRKWNSQGKLELNLTMFLRKCVKVGKTEHNIYFLRCKNVIIHFLFYVCYFLFFNSTLHIVGLCVRTHMRKYKK